MFRAINPTTGTTIEEVPHADAATLESLVAAADAAAAKWRLTPLDDRARLCATAARVLRARSESLARIMTLEMGKPITEALGEVEKCAWVCEYYAERAAEFLAPETIATDASESCVQHDPLGIVLAVMPWNFPLWQVFRFAAPALVAGNVGLLKHAPAVPGCARAIQEIMDEAGYPEGVFTNLFVAESTVAELIADHRVAAVSLTGSVGAGRTVAALAGRAIKPCVLELGGSDPCLVLADADLDIAIDGVMVGRFLNGGQSCIADKRIIVVDDVHDRFVERLVERVDALRVGDPMDPGTQLGPLAREDLRATLADQVARTVDAGARCLRGGGPNDGPGWFYPPTVLVDVAPGMPAFDDETFGPVAAVIRADDTRDALALANLSTFGLGASVYTRDAASAVRDLVPHLRTGHVAVNGIVKSDPRLPFGGIRDSGFGRELGSAGIHAFVNAKTVWVR